MVDGVGEIGNELEGRGEEGCKFKIEVYVYVGEKIMEIGGGEERKGYYEGNGYGGLVELNGMWVGGYYGREVKGNRDEYGNVGGVVKGEDLVGKGVWELKGGVGV